ncbi:MAG: hypothetical protein E7317_01010 [Clostridiales bacterium]|nr:hypothetical protein [Clostridiales bacterium]
MRMRAVIALLLALVLGVPACLAEPSDPQFKRLSDPALLPYIEDTLYSELVSTLDNDQYFVENVSAVYISQEYLEELAFNSKSNIYFGYTLDELEEQFQGERYVFTLGANGQTVVKKWEPYDDTYERVIRNVAVGTGVILVCVTVSVVTAGAAPAVSMIFTVAAKEGAKGALAGAALGGVSAGIVTGIQTGDMDQALKSAALAGSEGFKWGAISGVIKGGVTETIGLKGATLHGLSMDDAARIQRDSKYPLDVIKEFRSIEQYNICKEAGLMPEPIGGRTALVRSIDTKYIDEMGRTNLERMEQGLSAIDPKTGEPFQLHHIGQQQDSTLAILTRAEHMQGGNNGIWHEIGKATEIDRNAFNKQRAEFWMNMAKLYV